jgi:hypothetical protein
MEKEEQMGGARKTRRNKKDKKVNDEKGCVVPLYGQKARCILQIVPQEVKSATIQIDGRCIKKRVGV